MCSWKYHDPIIWDILVLLAGFPKIQTLYHNKLLHFPTIDN